MPVPLEIKILPMTMDHLSGVMEVERQSFPYPWSQDAFMFELLHNKVACYLVAMAEETLVGYAETAKANDADKKTLEVRKSNWGARKLYENHGFKALGCRRNYYADTHEDAVIMWKFDL